jgi:hypothetical protein
MKANRHSTRKKDSKTNHRGVHPAEQPKSSSVAVAAMAAAAVAVAEIKATAAVVVAVTGGKRRAKALFFLCRGGVPVKGNIVYTLSRDIVYIFYETQLDFWNNLVRA